MSLPDVTVVIAPGVFLPGNGGGNIDAIIGPCSRGRVGSVAVIADPANVRTLLGYGPVAELAAQTLSQTRTSLVCCPATITAGTIANAGVMSKSRSGAPTLTAKQLMGLALEPLGPSSANTGNGRVTFDADTTPVLRGASTPDSSATYTSIQVLITTAGAPGTAVMTTKIGGVTMQTGVTVPSSPYTVLDAAGNDTGMVLNFAVPSSGQFKVGDSFLAVPTQNDNYNVLVTITGVAANGVAQGTVSLDGGITQSGLLNFLIGGNVTSSGATAPDLVLSGTPSASHRAVVTFTRSGTAQSVRAQAGTWTGLLFNTAATRTHTGTAKITTPSSGQTSLVVVAITTGGTCVGTATSSAPTTGTGTGAGTITIDGVLVATFAANHFPATFTDLNTGIVLTFSGTTITGDSYTNAGTCQSDNGSADSSTGTMAVTTATTGAVNVPVSLVVTADGTAVGTASNSGATSGTGTATGTLTIGVNSWTFDTPGGGSGTGGMPAVFTDATTGVVVTLYAGASGIQLRAGDTYGDGAGSTRLTYPVAQYSYTIDGGSAQTGNTIDSTGLTTAFNTATGATATFSFTGSDVYTYDGTTAANTTTYSFNTYAPCVYDPIEKDGSLTGLRLSFAFGAYDPGDEFTVACTAPSVLPADVATALTTLYAAQLGAAAPFRRIGILATPGTIATVATIAAATQATLDGESESPTWKFNRAILLGPDATSQTSGATPDDAITALGLLNLDRINVTGGADYLTSVLTGRRDLRNCGFAIFARLVATPLSQDVGFFSAGALNNVFSTTTQLSDALTFWDNRVISTRGWDGYAGVYAVGGKSLAQAATTYSVSAYGFLADMLATLARQFELPYLNDSDLPTVRSNGVTTLDPGAAGNMNNNVAGLIGAQMVPGLLQSVSVAFSTTADIGNTDPHLPVVVSGIARPILRHIDTTITIDI